MVQKPSIKQVTISFSSFIPFSVPWDAGFDKVLFKVPRGPYTGKTYVKGPDMTDPKAFIQSLTGALSEFRVFPELGNNRSFEMTLCATDRMRFKMHLDAQLQFRIENVGGKTSSTASLRNVNALGGNAVRLNRETWMPDKIRRANGDGLSVAQCGASSSAQRPLPETAGPVLSAADHDWRARYQSGEVVIIEIDMACGNPLLEIVNGLAKHLGAMRVHGLVWINPIERWLIHNLKIAAFPAYEGYIQIDGSRIVALLQDQVPTGNMPFHLNPISAHLTKSMRPAQNYGVEIDL